MLVFVTRESITKKPRLNKYASAIEARSRFLYGLSILLKGLAILSVAFMIAWLSWL